MLRPIVHQCHREEGQVLAMGVVLLTALLGMLGVIIDGGSYLQQRRQAQNAADAAAVAAASALHDGASIDTATSAAKEYATANGYGNAGANTVTVNIPPTAGPHKGSASYAEVIISQKPNTYFIQAVVPAANSVSGRGVAGYLPGAPCAMCVLSPHAHQALGLSNNGYLTVTNGGVIVNSDANDAADLTNNARITATSIGVVGGALAGGNSTYSPTPVHGITPLPDPLAAVPVPSLSGSNLGSVSVSSGSQTLSPGIYTNLTATNNGTITLNPGVYVVTGTVNANNNGILRGTGVMVYFACSAYPTPCTAGQIGGQLNMSNNAAYALTAPTSGPYQGIAIFYDRNNAAPVTLENNAGDTLSGTLYAASAHLDLSNNGGTGQLNSLIVVSTASLSNNGTVNLNFDGAKNYPLTSATALVE
jgi:hypothetical protein